MIALLLGYSVKYITVADEFGLCIYHGPVPNDPRVCFAGHVAQQRVAPGTPVSEPDSKMLHGFFADDYTGLLQRRCHADTERLSISIGMRLSA